MVKPSDTTTVPIIAHHDIQLRSRCGPGSTVGQRQGTRCSVLTASAVSSGAPISSMGTGRNSPAISNGRPGSSQATIAIAGANVSLANPRPTASPAPANLADLAGPAVARGPADLFGLRRCNVRNLVGDRPPVAAGAPPASGPPAEAEAPADVGDSVDADASADAADADAPTDAGDAPDAGDPADLAAPAGTGSSADSGVAADSGDAPDLAGAVFSRVTVLSRGALASVPGGSRRSDGVRLVSPRGRSRAPSVVPAGRQPARLPPGRPDSAALSPAGGSGRLTGTTVRARRRPGQTAARPTRPCQPFRQRARRYSTRGFWAGDGVP